jgi:hypothetical protein
VGYDHEERSYFIYEGLLKHCSSYFRTALKEQWKEGATKTIKLTEDDPDVFEIFFHWIFKRTLYSKLSSEGWIPYSSMQLSKLFVFADARGIPELGNAAIDVFVQTYFQRWGSPVPSLNYIYKNTMHGSLLRRVVVDFAVETGRFDFVHSYLADFPKEFLADALVKSFAVDRDFNFTSLKLGLKAYRTAKVKQLCQYHDHPKPESKP